MGFILSIYLRVLEKTLIAIRLSLVEMAEYVQKCSIIINKCWYPGSRCPAHKFQRQSPTDWGLDNPNAQSAKKLILCHQKVTFSHRKKNFGNSQGPENVFEHFGFQISSDVRSSWIFCRSHELPDEKETTKFQTKWQDEFHLNRFWDSA